MSVTNKSTTYTTDSARAFLHQLIGGYSPRDFAVRFWDDTTLEPDAGQTAQFTLVLQHPGALRQMFWPFNKAAGGEAYIYNDVDIEGNVEAFFNFIGHLRARRPSPWQGVKLLLELLRMPKSAKPRTGRQAAQLTGKKRSLERDRRAIQYHYDDPPTEFFGLFLDPLYQYTCGFFANADEDLNTAQERKVDYICRKLRLQPGEKLVDFGCGWGGLITHAARNYGVEAVGVSLSKRQIDVANGLIHDMGLRGRCRVEYMDYRQFPETEQFDKAVSVGFCEHIGEQSMPTFFGKVWRLLRPNGLYLHHAITLQPLFTPFRTSEEFGRRYVFPDGDLASITNTQQQLAAAGLEIRDVESLREHYVLTLQHWLARLESNHEKVVQLTDEVTYRVFRIYFAASADAFTAGRLNIYQTLVAKTQDAMSGLPLTRTDWHV
jgi:cyclopropane-fatty-acyl-phospholipid synthase